MTPGRVIHREDQAERRDRCDDGKRYHYDNGCERHNAGHADLHTRPAHAGKLADRSFSLSYDAAGDVNARRVPGGGD